MAVESKQHDAQNGTMLPPADPALDHPVYMGPNLDRLLHLRPQDLLKPHKAKKRRKHVEFLTLTVPPASAGGFRMA